MFWRTRLVTSVLSCVSPLLMFRETQVGITFWLLSQSSTGYPKKVNVLRTLLALNKTATS